jgi:signal transduction histidine kinase
VSDEAAAGQHGGTAFVLAPRGRDAGILERLLGEASIASRGCADVAALGKALSDETTFVLMTEEAGRTADLRPLVRFLQDQPSWSDLPFLLLTQRGGGPEINPNAARLAEALGNVSFVERPFHAATLLSVARSALRARRRQYQARAQLKELAETGAQLRKLTATLEERVAARTAEAARAEAALRQSQKLEMIGQLTGGVAHDFNNLLSAVLGNIEMLEKRLPDDERLRGLLANARAGAERGATLTKRMLAFARKQELDVSPTDLSALVAGLEPLFRQSVGANVDLRVEAEADLPPALIDANQLELALLNLVVNARDAMPEGGDVTVRIDLPREGNEAGHLRVAVIDTGEGMTPEVMARAVEPFFTTKGVGKGTGLGLAMIHGLAGQMNGALRLKSEVGKGTTAALWLPVAEGARAAPEAACAAPLPPSQDRADRPRRILVVDDDFLIAMNTEMMAQDLGHEVACAGSAAEALRLLSEDEGFDLVITDHAMPQMTGTELAAEIAVRWPRLPVILATGYVDLPDGQKSPLPRLPKPFSQAALSSAIGAAG